MGKIGVTEQGDAALDFSWVDKLGSVAGAIVITKELSPRKSRALDAASVLYRIRQNSA